MGRFLADVASEKYGITGAGDDFQSFLPRLKFQFWVYITFLKPDAPSGQDTVQLSRIASIDLPSYTPRTQTLNQYNRKRIIQTGFDYTPINIVAYDTKDALIEKIIKSYSNFYFAGPMNSADQTRSFEYDVSNPSFITGISQHGLRLQNQKNFLKNIKIVRASSIEDNNTITIYNPMITALQADTLTYSDSQPVTYNISLSYEGYDVSTSDLTVLDSNTDI